MIDPKVRERVREILLAKHAEDVELADDELERQIARAERIQARAAEVARQRTALAARRHVLERSQIEKMIKLRAHMEEASARYHAAAAALENERIRAEQELSQLTKEDQALLESLRAPKYNVHPIGFKASHLHTGEDPRELIAASAEPLHVGGGWVNLLPGLPLPMPGGHEHSQW